MSFTPQKKRRLRVKKLVLVLVAIYVMIGAGLYLLQEKMLFLPTVLPQEHMYSFDHPFEEVYLFPDDGASLNGIHFKVESPKGVILYFHGNAGDLQRWGEITEYFRTTIRWYLYISFFQVITTNIFFFLQFDGPG